MRTPFGQTFRALADALALAGLAPAGTRRDPLPERDAAPLPPLRPECLREADPPREAAAPDRPEPRVPVPGPAPRPRGAT